MALLKKTSTRLKSNNDTGFGSNAENYGGRFVNKDGTFNVKKEGTPFWERISIFHYMLNIPLWKFISIILLIFLSINLIFTFIYLEIGQNEFIGIIATTRLDLIRELFFFSTETFSTVGYGRVNPVGGWANLASSLDALSGSLFFAVVTGLMYGRFSKPKAFLTFTKHALITPYHDISGLMFRLVSYKNNHTLTNVEVKVSLSLLEEENGKMTYKFYDLPLERTRIDSLPMNLTVVHPIDENSPLQGLTNDDMRMADLEIYVLVRAFDDVYSNTVLQRTSYTYDEIIFDAKFIQMYRESEDGRTTIVELNKLNEYKNLKAQETISTS